MRILLCCEQILSPELGIAKVLLELAAELTALGWDCHLRSNQDLAGQSADVFSQRGYAQALFTHLCQEAHHFDVVDYPYNYLPYPLAARLQRTLFVGRSALLHLPGDRLPTSPPAHWWTRLARPLTQLQRRWRQRRYFQMARQSLDYADLLNVNNRDDRRRLIQFGVSAAKVVVLPLGLTIQRRQLFEALPLTLPSVPRLAFVGSFDPRKGSLDMPHLFSQIANRFPAIQFRLLGAMRPRETVLQAFPTSLHHRLEVIPRFAAETLPQLLADCTLGVFPSYQEGFGLGVLEMLAAGLPVFAYAVPGPPMMLPPEYLVPRGDVAALADRVIALLQHQDRLLAAKQWARERSRRFHWPQIAQQTARVYHHFWQQKQQPRWSRRSPPQKLFLR